MPDWSLLAMVAFTMVFGAVLGALLFGSTGAVVGAAIMFCIGIGALAGAFWW